MTRPDPGRADAAAVSIDIGVLRIEGSRRDASLFVHTFRTVLGELVRADPIPAHGVTDIGDLRLDPLTATTPTERARELAVAVHRRLRAR